jgi:hypothetical protein
MQNTRPQKRIWELVRLAEKLGLQSADLDLAVHDCAQEVELPALNALEDEDAQDDHITSVEQHAAAINNGGLEAQIGFLLEHSSRADVRELLSQLEWDQRSGDGRTP